MNTEIMNKPVTKVLAKGKTNRSNELYNIILVEDPQPRLIGPDAEEFEALERTMHYYSEMEKLRISGQPCPRIGMFDKPVGNTSKKALKMTEATDSTTTTSTITTFKGP